MSSITSAASKRGKKRAVLVAVGALAAVGGAVLSTNAFLSDSQSVTGNSIATGGVSLDIKNAGVAVAPISVPAMLPGDTVTITVPVKNAGAVDLRYRVQLVNEAGSGVGVLDSALSSSGTVSGEGTSPGASPSQAIATGALSNNEWLFGNTADTERQLTVGKTDSFPLTITLPSSADNTVAGKSLTFDLQFTAEQTDGNAFAALP